MKNKRGSHIDAIISFMVFIGIIIFLYAVIQPKVASQQDKMEMLGYAEAQIAENVSANLTTVPIGIKASGNCFEFTGFSTVTGISSPHAIIGDGSATYSLGSSSGDIYVSSVGNLPSFLILSDSPIFSETGSFQGETCKALTYGASENGYTVGEVRTDRYIFSSEISKVISDYSSNYDKVKQQLSIPAGTDFGFSFTYQNQTNIGTDDYPPSQNVYVENFPVRYIDESGNIKAGNLVIRIW